MASEEHKLVTGGGFVVSNDTVVIDNEGVVADQNKLFWSITAASLLTTEPLLWESRQEFQESAKDFFLASKWLAVGEAVVANNHGGTTDNEGTAWCATAKTLPTEKCSEGW